MFTKPNIDHISCQLKLREAEEYYITVMLENDGCEKFAGAPHDRIFLR